jgi:hypothetical protein
MELNRKMYIFIYFLLQLNMGYTQVNPNKCRDFYLGCVNYYLKKDPVFADTLFRYAIKDTSLDSISNSLTTMQFAKIQYELGKNDLAWENIKKSVSQGYPTEWVTAKKFPNLKDKINPQDLDSVARTFFKHIHLKAYFSALELDNILNFNIRILSKDSTIVTKRQQLKIDSLRLIKLKNHINTFGFPTNQQIGAAAVGNFTYYTEQLAVYYPNAWNYIAGIYEKALLEGKLDPYYYANFHDHKSLILDEKGKYGTEYHKPRKGIKGNPPFEYPLRDAATIDYDRQNIGIPPIFIHVYGIFSDESKLPKGYSFDEDTFRKNIFDCCK